jgi:hypothetical protein
MVLGMIVTVVAVRTRIRLPYSVKNVREVDASPCQFSANELCAALSEFG